MAKRYRIAILIAHVAAGLPACGGSGPSSLEARKAGPVAGEAAVDMPIVEFCQASLTIDRLELPFAPPITPGSTPSPTTMASDAPDVVSIQADGGLVAHRNGHATIRALEGKGSLEVEVIAAAGLRAEPLVLRVHPGIAALPMLKSGDATLPIGAAMWFSNTPDVAMVEDGRIRAGPARGTATLTAVYGGEKVQVTVVVGNHGPRKK